MSSDSSGNKGNGQSSTSSSSYEQVSSDGRYVVFTSGATNLVPNDTNGVLDVFVKDTQTGTTTAVSVTPSGALSSGQSDDLAISYDGRYVVFQNAGGDLVSGVSGPHIYRRDLQTGTTVVVDTTAAGAPSSSTADDNPVISADDRYVAFLTRSGNLLGLSYNPLLEQAVVKDMDTGAVRTLSENSSGVIGNGVAQAPSISCDGSIIVFEDNATNLTTSYSGNGDMDLYMAKIGWGGNDLTDISASFNASVPNAQVSCDGNSIVYDTTATNAVTPSASGLGDAYEYSRASGKSVLVSRNSSGIEGNAKSGTPAVSDDGRYVAFMSYAPNMDVNYPPPVGSQYENVYVRDMKTGTTEVVDITAANAIGNSASEPSISADGSYVTYGYQTPVAGTNQVGWVLISGVTASTPNSRSDIYESKTGF